MPDFDPLEQRQLLTSFDVTNTSDSGMGSLRQAILNSNSTPGSNYIAFDIPASTAANLNVPVSGFSTTTQLWTINLTEPLPTITNPVDIDGLSEAHLGEYYNYPTNFTSEVDSITIDPAVTGGTYEITVTNYTDQSGVTQGGTTAAIPWDATAAQVQTALSAIVTGTTAVTVSGPTSAQASAVYTITFGGNSTGLAIAEAITNSTLVGATPGATLAVVTAGGATSDTSTEIVSTPNSASATTGDNAENRVVLNGSAINTTTYPNPTGFTLNTSYAMIRGMIITGFDNGVSIPNADNVGDLVQGNFIGSYVVHPVNDITGGPLVAPNNEYIASGFSSGYANTGAGVLVYGTNTTVGGASAQDNNVITSNAEQGIFIEAGAEGAQVLGNQVGVLGPSTAGVYYKLHNGAQGILVEASSNRIGASGAGNLISANDGDGVAIIGATSTQNVVAGNYIGNAPGGGYVFGNAMPGNQGDGIDVDNAPGNIIGVTGAGNTVSSNAEAGIVVTGTTAVSNIIADNTVGLTSDQTQVLGNAEEGIAIYSADTTVGPSNVVSGNNVGILVSGSSATSTNITGNFVGTDGGGSEDLGNAQQGILIDNAAGVTIQGNATGSQVISGNNVGIEIEGSSTGALIFGNLIGTDKSGTLPLPNAQQGILIEGAAGNTIGGSTAGAKNLVSANYWGIQIDGAGATDNVVAGNQIGTDITGKLPLGNEIDGVYISNSAASNTIGGTASGVLNQIGYNTDSGIEVSSANQDSLLSNALFSNGLGGITLDGTANNSQVAPDITGVGGGGTTANIQGTLTGTVASTSFLIQFFSNTTTDSAQLYEAQTYLGSTTITTNASGDGSINYTLTGGITVGDFITATATNLSTGDTSELSNTTAGTAVSAQAVTVNFSASTYNVNSTTAYALIDVLRSGNLAVSVSVAYATSNGSAEAGLDYSTASGTLVFLPGASDETFQVRILNNTRSQTSESTVGLSLSGPTGGATLGTTSASTLVITNSSTSVSQFIVLNTSDSAPGSLRAAILAADASTSTAPISIQFEIPASTVANLNVPVPGFNPATQIWTIDLLSPLPDITVPMDIDGYSEANIGVPYRYPSALTSQTDGLDIDSSVTGGTFQLTIPAYTDDTGVTRGGTITNIPYNASATFLQEQLESIVGSSSVTVLNASLLNNPGNYTISFAGDSTGLAITINVTGNSLVGTNPVATLSVIDQGGEVLSAATEITSVPNSTAAIDGNNAQNRVIVNGSTINSGLYPTTTGFVLDTSYAMLRGLIIGGFTTGVSIPQATDIGDLVQGNDIGAYFVYPVDPISGSALASPNNEYTVAAGNATIGVDIYGTNTTIGGASTQDDNIIGDNGDQGIIIEPGAEGAQILGNQIGVIGPSIGTVYWHASNGSQGILVEASSNRIGAAGAGNIISANLGAGIKILGTAATQNVIAANYIGDAPGGSYIFGNGTPGNGTNGVEIINAPSNIIGQSGAGNVISSNANDGISITGASAISTIIAYNIVGLTADGSQVLGNGQNGIAVYSAYTTIGPGNTVSANNVGILVSGNTATNINIVGNLVGTDATGEQDLGNVQQGILIDNASGATIQGNATGSQVISGNNVGIEVEGSSAGILITGNFVGTDKAGALALPNAQQGIYINGTANNTIGGTAATERNLISANYWGIQIDGAGATGNILLNNLIGTDITGTLPLGNETDGVLVSNLASGNTIGGKLSSQGNTIAFNTDAGVSILSGNANPILTNSIFSNGQIGIVLGVTGNDAIVSPALITAATSPTSDSTTVRGTYTSLPDLSFLIQFFSNVAVDPSGNYEGQTYLGSTTVATNSSGVADFTVSLPMAVTSGEWITATATFLTIATPPATLNNGDTSEFSGAVQAINPFLVTTTADSLAFPVPGMLRYAIQYSNSFPSPTASSPNVIQFQITGGSLETIYLVAALPQIVSPVTIDGFSQPGTQTNDSSQLVSIHADDDQETDIAIILIQVDGSQINDPSGTAVGFDIAAPGSTIDGLSITGFKGAAIQLEPGTDPATASLGDTIWGNEIGVTQFSSSSYNVVNPATNIYANGIGVLVDSPNNVIGGALPPDRNIIQGNTSDGVVVYGTQGTNNAVETNFILDNGADGVLLLSANNQVGLSSGVYLAGAGNLISGNADSGIHILGPAARNNLIQNNQIGTQVGFAGQVTPILGTRSRPNSASGITIENAPNNVVGGQIASASNVIAGNALAGLTIENYVNGQAPVITGIIVNPPLALQSATANVVQGNDIGFNVKNGQIYLIPNLQDGIAISSASNQIGGTSTQAQNIVIDNARNGIAITASYLNSSDTPTGSIPNAQPNTNLLQGNYIGTQTGANHYGNALDGIFLVSAIANTIGGTASGAVNVISGNAGNGIGALTSNSNVIAGNVIGTTADASTALGNSRDGIVLDNSPSNTIGGTTSAAANVIAANTNGIHLSGAASTYNTIEGNFIGTNSSLASLLGNSSNGVLFDTSASSNYVGGATGAANTIAYNGATGVLVSSGTGDSILSNSIFSNVQRGIILTGTGNNAIPAPVITEATPQASSTVIAGTFSSPFLPSTVVLIQVFSNQQADPSGYGQGQTLIGSTTLITNAQGVGTFTLTLAAGVATSLAISATATNIVTGDTSQFSADIVNAGQIAFSSSTYAAGEPLSSYTVTVLRNTSYGSSTVNFAATAGTAIPNVDFTPITGTLTFVSGQSSATFAVPINSEPPPPGNFTILLSLSNPTSATLGSPNTAVLEVDSIPGSLAFSSSTYMVAAGSGQTSITIVRLDGAAGTVSVSYAAAYSQAFAAVPSGFLSGTVTFSPGVTQQSFALPVPATGSSPYTTTATLTLYSATGGAALVSPSSATLIVTQPLTVTGESINASGGTINSIEIDFSGQLNPTQAQNLANYGYYAITSNATGTFIDVGVNAIPLASAIYNSSSQSVTITPAAPLHLNTFYRITLDGVTNGILSNGISDTYGNLLAGNGTNAATPFAATFALGNHLTYTDGSGNFVSLKLNHGGLIEMFRAVSGAAQQVTLVGTTPQSALTGSVQRLVRGTGRSALPTISAPTGARLKLPRPAFVLSNPPITSDPVPLSSSPARVKTQARVATTKLAAVDAAIASISSSRRSRSLARVKPHADHASSL